jgi:hypothetical protein
MFISIKGARFLPFHLYLLAKSLILYYYGDSTILLVLCKAMALRP